MIATDVVTESATADYIESAVKPDHVVVIGDKKVLEIPTGLLLSFSGYASL